MQVGLWEFITIFVMVFALFLFIVGVFTAYFGSGKSRKIGIGLTVGGFALGFLYLIASTGWLMGGYRDRMISGVEFWVPDFMIQVVIMIVAAVLGALVALGIFLIAIMKS